MQQTCLNSIPQHGSSSSPDIITLYHGSVHALDVIDVARGKPFKDFGIGFYTSHDKEHAVRLALRNRDIEALVIGPTANDNTNATVDLFMLGTYGDPKSDSAVDMFLQLIRPDILPPQMFFGSQRAADLLKYVDRNLIC
jgi:hypothetical protein